jgi:hypothetical protein
VGWFKTTPLTARSGTGGVSISMLKPPSAGVPTMRLRLGRRAMAATGWADGKAVELLFGDEEHAGKIMLRPADGDGGSRLRAPRKRSPSSIDTTFGYLPRDPIAGAGGSEWTLLQEPHPAVEVDWSRAENALVISLPREWWQVATPASVAGRREAAVAIPARPAKRDAEPGPESEAFADPGPPRSDPNDPKLQDMARHLLSKGCTLPELRVRLRLDEAGFKILCATLRERGARKAAPEPAAHAETPRDVKGEIARIRGLAAPNGSARP